MFKVSIKTIIAIHDVISILLQIDEKSRSMESKEYSTISVFPPPNSTIFVLVEIVLGYF